MTTCRIIRFHEHGGKEIIYEGVPIDEAKELCSQPWTSGDGWFDGWTVEEKENDEDDNS